LHTAQPVEHAVCEHALDQCQAGWTDGLGLLQAINRDCPLAGQVVS